MTRLLVIILAAISPINMLPLINSDSGFSIEAGANWWKPTKGATGVKTGGDGFYLTETFHSQIFEPLADKIIRSIDALHKESVRQQKFDVAITTCFVAFLIAATTTILITVYRNYCKKMEKSKIIR